MTEGITVAIISAGALLLSVLLGMVRGKSSARDEIRTDLEIADKLPEGSTKKALLTSIDERVRLIVGSQKGRRDWSGFSVAIFLIVFSASMYIIAARVGGVANLLYAVGAIATIIGLFGFFESLRTVPRDEKGRAIGGRASQDRPL